MFTDGYCLAPERRRQRMILVQHDRNLTVFGTDHNLDVQPDQRAQAFFDSGNTDSVDAAHHIDDPFLGDVHGMRHDVEQDFVFRLEVVIEAALGKLERGGDIVHGSGIVSALLKEAGGGAQDFLARFDGSFAERHPEMVSRNGVRALPAHLKFAMQTPSQLSFRSFNYNGPHKCPHLWYDGAEPFPALDAGPAERLRRQSIIPGRYRTA